VAIPDDMRFAVSLSRDHDATAVSESLLKPIAAELKGRPADLAFLFVSPEHAEQMAEIAATLRDELGHPVLLGCTGEGVIAGAEEIERGPAAVLWAAALPGVRLMPMQLSATERDDGYTIEGWPAAQASGSPIFVMLADPFSAPMDEILSETAERFPGAKIIGGMAGGGREAGENRLLLNDDAVERGAVAVGISGALSIRTVVSQGCRPIGDRYIVTKADHNVIHELGGAPALQRLEEMFTALSSTDRELAQRALHIGIVIDEHRNSFDRGDFLVRNLIGADRSSGSVAIGDVVREGQTIQFHVRDADAASEDLRLLMNRDRLSHRGRPKGALLFSCCARGRGLFGAPHHDVTAVRALAGAVPIAGFFAQGEIGPVGGSNFLHGYTASVAIFAERTDVQMEENDERALGGRL
jgi:small ligand-binding sensory domain FIST